MIFGLAPDEGAYRQMLLNQTAGKGPSLAQALLAKQNADALRGMYGMAANTTGVNSALARRNAMEAGTELAGKNAETGAVQRTQEQLGAQQQFGQFAQAEGAAQDKLISSGIQGAASFGAMLSDRRTKTDVSDGGGDSDALMEEMKPRMFRYRGEDGPRRLGVMAQDVEEGAPELVRDVGGAKGIDMPKSIGAALAAVARLHERVKKLEGKR